MNKTQSTVVSLAHNFMHQVIISISYHAIGSIASIIYYSHLFFFCHLKKEVISVVHRGKVGGGVPSPCMLSIKF